jgi:hypothetical protein
MLARWFVLSMQLGINSAAIMKTAWTFQNISEEVFYATEQTGASAAEQIY